MIKTYIKKPLPVQAVYLKESPVDEIIKLLDSCVTKYEPIIDMKDKSKVVGFLIHSWEGAEPQFLGDDYYIIKGIKVKLILAKEMCLEIAMKKRK